MSQIRDTSSNAAARAAGRELLDAALQSHPMIGPAATLLGSLVGLFRRRAQTGPGPERKLKLERHSPQAAASLGGSDPKPDTPTPKAGTNAERKENEGNTKAGVLRGRRRPPSLRWPVTGRTKKGGHHHG